MIDDELRGASDDLRRAVDNVAIPPFEPIVEPEITGPVSIVGAPSKRRTFPTRILAVAASIVLVATGAVTALRLSEGQETNAGTPDGAQDSAQLATGTSDAISASGDTSWQNGVSGVEELDESELVKPEPGQRVLDPTFNTTIQAVDNSSTSSSLIPLQVRPAWNADGSRMLTYRSGSGFSLVDTETMTELGALPINPADIEQVYWHPGIPSQLYFVDNADDGFVYLKSFNIDSRSTGTVHTYDGCTRVSGANSYRISADTLLLGQLCETDEGSFLVSFNLKTGATLRQPAGDFGAPQPTPASGRYVVRDPEGLTRVLDNQLQPTGVEFNTGDDHMAVIETAQGQELLVTTVFSGDDTEVGSVVAFDLVDGSSTVIVGPATGYPYPPSTGGLATSVANDGRIVVATNWDSEQALLTGEIIIIDFDQPVPVVKRVAHHRSTAQNAVDSNWSVPYPSLHPLRSSVAFASDWDGTHASPFIISD